MKPLTCEIAKGEQIRWFIDRDMDEVMPIELASFKYPWTEEEFVRVRRIRSCIGSVFERDHVICGYVLYNLREYSIEILNLAVAPCVKRQQIGSKMIKRLIDKLSEQRRRAIVVNVRESSVAAQLFFKHCGFRCVQVIRKAYTECGEDAYVMRYRIESWNSEESEGGSCAEM